MAYITYEYYSGTFHGSAIPEADFARLAEVASDVVYAICLEKPAGPVLLKNEFKDAVAYQVEFIHEQGGLEAIYGRSDASQSGGSERLGDYNVSSASGSGGNFGAVKMYDGIPLSSLTLALLEKLGLMSQWVYAYRYQRQ